MRAVHNFAQGSAPWHQHRLTVFNASEAPAVMGASKYTSRSELLRLKATGIAPEVSPHKQALFDRGHAVEGPTIAMIEALIGDSLAPIVASIVIDGMTIGASYDGLTLMDDTAAEVKLWNEDLAQQIRSGILDMHYVWQLEQQFIVTPSLERIIFAASDGTPEHFVHMEYRPVPGRREQLLAGWKQFEADLAAYVPPAARSVEKIVAEPVEALPAPVVQVTGQLTLQDNFKVFEQRLRDFLENRLIREPKTDQDFADLDGQIKAMKQARVALKAAGAQMLAQLEPVDRAAKTQAMLDDMLQKNCAMAEKLLSGEKERRKGEIVAGGVKALADHVAALNARLGKPYMPQVPADFGGCIRGLKSLSSMEDKVATELARAKIAANEAADRIDTNLQALHELASDHPYLFADTATLVLKAPDDCRAQIEARIAAHRAEQERKLEAERARIRQEEEARAQRQAQEREAAERRQREEAEAAQRRQEEEQESAAPAPAVVAFGSIAPQAGGMPLATSPAVIPMPTRAPAAPQSAPTLRLGQINERIAPLSIDAAGLAALGFPHAATEKAAKLYHEADFPLICSRIVEHVSRVRDQKRAA